MKSILKFQHLQWKVILIADIFPESRTPKDVVRKRSRKSRFKRPFDKQHGKRSQTLLKSEGQHLYHSFWSMGRNLSWKNSVLVIWKILGHFVNTLIADDKYSLLNRDNFNAINADELCKTQKTFSASFLQFWYLDKISKTLKQKMTLIGYVFWNLQTAKDVVRWMCKKYGFRRPFNKRHDKRSQTLSKTEGQHLYHHYSWLWRLLSWKKSVLVICKILGLFVNTMTAADKNAVLNLDNFNAIKWDKRNKKLFLIFLLDFWNLDQIWKILKTRRPS